MPTPTSLSNFQVFGHPLGQEMEIIWTMPSLPDAWNVVVLRREGSAITDGEVTQYFAGAPFDDIEAFIFTSTEYPDGLEGFSDYGVDNNATYYYKAVLQDTSDSAVSATVTDNAKAQKIVTTKIIDAKQFILTVVERVMKSYGMEKDEHYQLLREYSLPIMKAPIIYVTRVGGQVLNQFLGYFRQVASDGKAIYGEIEMDNIQVVWEDPNPTRRDNLTNIFRETKEFIREYLMHPNGGGMISVEILIEGDVINEAVKDRTQVGGMMMISCMISGTTEIDPTLASWLTGLGTPQN